MGKTSYVVLRQNEDGSWDEFDVEHVLATSSKSAIRATLADTPINGNGKVGLFVAVPVRSWQPLPVEVETEQHFKIG